MEKMTEKTDLEYFRAKGLMPFQAEFAVSFLESGENRYWEFVSPVGMGKTRLGAALIFYELETNLNKRLLVLAPASLLSQWQCEISAFLTKTELPCNPIIIDRKAYLELESNTTEDKSPWPFPSVILMSIDLAKRDDMVSSLISVSWDLIIFDESHLLSGGKRKTLLERLKKSEVARRGLLLTAIPKFFDNVVTKMTNWDVVDWDGRPLFPSFEKKMASIYYLRTEAESDFFRELQGFTARLPNSLSYGKFLETNMVRIASSSMYALERKLRRLFSNWGHLRNKIAHSVPWSGEDLESIQRDVSMGSDELAEVDELSQFATGEPLNFIDLYNELETLLDQIEDVSVDSKLDALISYVQEFYEDNNQTHLCIWCSYTNTVQYLGSSLQELGQPVWSNTGALGAVERMARIESFRQNGGILITTDAASEGATLEYVDECINYDLPINQQAFDQRWGRFLRLGRKRDFRMLVLKDESKTLLWEDEVFNTFADSDTSQRLFP